MGRYDPVGITIPQDNTSLIIHTSERIEMSVRSFEYIGKMNERTRTETLLACTAQA